MVDLYDAQGVIEQTPTFIVIYGGKGTVIRGGRDAGQFVSTLKKLLELSVDSN